MEPADRRCPFCGSRRSVAITAGLAPIVADASNPALAAELQETMSPDIVVLRELGRGGMGLVFLAREPALRRLVVIKVLAPELASDTTARARFRREAEAAAAVAHPNVVAVYQAGELPRSKTAYLVMQFIDGPTLAEEFPAGTVAPEARAKRVMGEVAAALAAAHARGLIHRDIKPANIMLERDTGRAIVLDFGVSAARHSAEHRPGPRITQEGVTLGTPVYMSPEQAAAEPVTDRSDVYSLGVVMFELVTGHAPFDERTPVALAAAHLHKLPPVVESVRPDLDPDFAGLIDRCLAKGADARPDAATIARALGPATSHTLEWPPPGLARLHGLGREALRRHLLAAGAGLVYLTILAWFGTSVAGPGWLLLSAGLVAIAVGLGLGVERSSSRALRWIWAGRQAGYPAGVLFDVALDPRRESGSLVTGTGSFAMIARPERDQWLAHRRWAAAAEASGLALSGIAMALWLLGAFGDAGGSAFAILGMGIVTAIFLPALLGQTASMVLRRRELRLRFSSARRSESWIARLRPPIIRRDLALAWLAEAGRPALSPRSPWRARGLRLLSGLWTLPSILAAVILLSILWAGAFTLTPIRAADVDAWSTWLEKAGPQHAAAAPWFIVSRQVDTVLAGWSGGVPDTGLARAMLMDAYGPPASDRKEWANLRTPADSAMVASAWATLPGQLTSAQRARLAADTAGYAAGLAAFRTLARDPLPGGWYHRPGLPTVLASAKTFRLITDYALRDAAAGALALAAGDRASAGARAREVLGVSRTLLAAPSTDVVEAGLRLAQSGGRMLQLVEGRNGNAQLVRRGEMIEVNAFYARAPRWAYPAEAASLAAAQLDTRTWLAVAGDHDLAPSVRWSSLEAIVDGACRNQRELIVGPSAERTALFHSMERLMTDLPSAAAIAGPVEARLQFIAEPWRIGSQPSGQQAVPPALVRPAISLLLRPLVCADRRQPGYRGTD